jgi:hypothetical protein
MDALRLKALRAHQGGIDDITGRFVEIDDAELEGFQNG